MINPAYELLASGENPAADPDPDPGPDPGQGRGRRDRRDRRGDQDR